MTGTGIQVFRGSNGKSEIEGDDTMNRTDDEETLMDAGDMTLDERRRLKIGATPKYKLISSTSNIKCASASGEDPKYVFLAGKSKDECEKWCTVYTGSATCYGYSHSGWSKKNCLLWLEPLSPSTFQEDEEGWEGCWIRKETADSWPTRLSNVVVDFFEHFTQDSFYSKDSSLHGRCGPDFLLGLGVQAECNPNDPERGVCCSREGWCTKERAKCTRAEKNYGASCTCLNGIADTKNMCALNNRNFCVDCNYGYNPDGKGNCVAGEDAVPFRKYGETCGTIDEGAICETTLLCMLYNDKSQPCPKSNWWSGSAMTGNPNCECTTVAAYQQAWTIANERDKKKMEQKIKEQREEFERKIEKFAEEQAEKERIASKERKKERKKEREMKEREIEKIRKEGEKRLREERHEQDLKWKTKNVKTQIFVLSIAGGLIILIALIVVIYCFCFRMKRIERERKARAESARAEEMAAAEGPSIGEGLDDGRLARMAEQRNYNAPTASSSSNNPQPSAPPFFDNTPAANPVYMIEVGGNVTTAVDGARLADATHVVTGAPVITAREVPVPVVSQTPWTLGPNTEGDAGETKSTKGKGASPPFDATDV